MGQSKILAPSSVIPSSRSLESIDEVGTVNNGEYLIYQLGQFSGGQIETGAVGDIIPSILSESDFQSQNGNGWVLADGRSVSGSSYDSTFSKSNVPDMRGVIPRGKDNGRGLTSDLSLESYTGDSAKLPNSGLSTSTENYHSHSGEAAFNSNHRHYMFHDQAHFDTTLIKDDPNENIAATGGFFNAAAYRLNRDTSAATPSRGVTSSSGAHTHSFSSFSTDGDHSHSITGGDSETAPNNVTVNFFIRIN